MQDGEPLYHITKALPIIHEENQLANNTTGAFQTVGLNAELPRYDVHIKGHSHPVQNEESRRIIGLDRIDSTVKDSLALREPGSNFSLSDLDYYRSNSLDSDYDERTLIMGTIVHDGEFMSLAFGGNQEKSGLLTLRNITADSGEGIVRVKVNSFEQEKSDMLFGKLNPEGESDFSKKL